MSGRESSYNYRRANVQAAYLLPHIKPNSSILDVGAGPGSITRDFADLCPEGRVIGVDFSSKMVETARLAYLRDCSNAPENLSFEVCNAEDLSRFPDATFDIVHAHTCISHVNDRIKALREFHRVCKPGGIIAIRDPLDIVNQIIWRPDVPEMKILARLGAQFLLAKGGHPEAGSHLAEMACEAGYQKDGGRLVIETAEEKQVKMLNFVGYGIGREEALRQGFTTEEELNVLSLAHQTWEGTKDHVCIAKVAEMLYFKGPLESVSDVEG